MQEFTNKVIFDHLINGAVISPEQAGLRAFRLLNTLSQCLKAVAPTRPFLFSVAFPWNAVVYLKAGLRVEIVCFKLYTQILLPFLLPLTSYLINVQVAELTDCKSERVKSVNPEIILRFSSPFMKCTCSTQHWSASNFHSNKEKQLMSQPKEEICH